MTCPLIDQSIFLCMCFTATWFVNLVGHMGHILSPHVSLLLQDGTCLPGPAALLDPPLHRQPGQQQQAGLRGRHPAWTLLLSLPGSLLHARLQTQSHAGRQHEKRCQSFIDSLNSL